MKTLQAEGNGKRKFLKSRLFQARSPFFTGKKWGLSGRDWLKVTFLGEAEAAIRSDIILDLTWGLLSDSILGVLFLFNDFIFLFRLSA